MENPGETPNVLDSQEAVGAASSILQNGGHTASEFPRTMPMSGRQFHIPHSVGTLLYGYPNYSLGNFSHSMSTGSIPFLHGGYTEPSFGYCPLPGHLSRPDIPEAPHHVAGSSSVARADQENAQELPTQGGRQNGAGRGSSWRARQTEIGLTPRLGLQQLRPVMEKENPLMSS
ncbi:hypothetical protein R1sor_019610 [Riccia sorocarpa]|uniref:Uncharacterized protein n=1 Tax=Riccia sorocarpa TaxID=122646 RepID=A0ABD3ID02_9MARC